MILKFLKSFWSYVPSDPWRDVPENEPPDLNANRQLSESYRTARKSLVLICAISIAWATAQFSFKELSVDALGVSVDLKSSSIPFLLVLASAYLAYRCVIEFAMMERHVRRWRLAQIDFRFISLLTRFSIMAVSAGMLDRSFRSILLVIEFVLGIAVLSLLLSIVLSFITMPIRFWARERAGRISAANAVQEGIFWAGLFGVVLTIFGVAGFAVASYRGQLGNFLWRTPPDPNALIAFLTAVTLFFISFWLVNPLYFALFAERPGYRTKRDENGNQLVQFINEEKEPIF